MENNCFAKFIILRFGYDDGEANRCNRFLVAEVRNHEGKPYFRDIERKVWLFYEVNCHRKAPSKTSFSSHCFRLKYGLNLTLSFLMMGNVEFLALMPQNAKYVYFFPLLPLYLAAHFRHQSHSASFVTKQWLWMQRKIRIFSLAEGN